MIGIKCPPKDKSQNITQFSASSVLAQNVTTAKIRQILPSSKLEGPKTAITCCNANSCPTAALVNPCTALELNFAEFYFHTYAQSEISARKADFFVESNSSPCHVRKWQQLWQYKNLEGLTPEQIQPELYCLYRFGNLTNEEFKSS